MAQTDVDWIYYHGAYPIFSHPADDLKQFRFFTAHLIDVGSCTPKNIINVFGVSKSSVDRSLRKIRDGGPEAFFKKRAVRKGGGKIFSPDVLKAAQQLLDQGYSRSEASRELGIKPDTFRKAIYDGRLLELSTKVEKQEQATTKSSRDVEDAKAADQLGTGCTRPDERTLAAYGMSQGAPVIFEPCLDVPNGGVLCALPALMLNGLLDGCKYFLGELTGYYREAHILLLVAYMALCRVKTTEQIRSYSPGEFGKIIGLDRVPEVKCLRDKLSQLSKDDSAACWAAHLSKRWLTEDSNAAGTLYIDGHVRVYHGGLTKLPKRFVSRDRLCLRGTTDYWVNDSIGRPFFVVEKVIDPGMIKTLDTDIIPRLLKDVPDQPTEKELEENPFICRFILVFDREGYSPKLMRRLWKDHRIGCITYKKFAKKDEKWPVEMFSDVTVRLSNGEDVVMRLAEQGSMIGSNKDSQVWVREVRKLTDSGHQTSLVSTAYDLEHVELAGRMFARWCQENFFRYMMRHYAIDLIVEYGTDGFPDIAKAVNPARRKLERIRNSLNSKLKTRQARFVARGLHTEPEKDTKKHEKWVQKKADMLEEIELYKCELEEVKLELKEMPTHINIEDMDEEDQFQQLRPDRKQLLDTIKMIAYRAETAMASILRCETIDTAAARQLIIDLCTTEADLIPDNENKQLRVRIHGASRPAANRAIERLVSHINEAEITYPGTDMQMVYELGECTKNEENCVT